jgi:hypothetical protein
MIIKYLEGGEAYGQLKRSATLFGFDCPFGGLSHLDPSF